MKVLLLAFLLEGAAGEDYSVVEISRTAGTRDALAISAALLHWPGNRMECRYNPASSPFDLATVERAIEAAGRAWERKSGLAFEYLGTTAQVPEGTVWDCLISWDLFPSVFKLGQAQNFRIGQDITGADIRLSRLVSEKHLRMVLTHEIGHGLGLGHNEKACIMRVSPKDERFCFEVYAGVSALYPPYEVDGRPALDCSVTLFDNNELYIPSIDGAFWARYKLNADLSLSYIEHGEIEESDVFVCGGLPHALPNQRRR